MGSGDCVARREAHFPKDFQAKADSPSRPPAISPEVLTIAEDAKCLTCNMLAGCVGRISQLVRDRRRMRSAPTHHQQTSVDQLDRTTIDISGGEVDGAPLLVRTPPAAQIRPIPRRR
jgi:hypothetical protein